MIDYGYWIAIGVVVLIASILFFIFRTKKDKVVQSRDAVTGLVTYQTIIDESGKEIIATVETKHFFERLVVVIVLVEIVKDLLLTGYFNPFTNLVEGNFDMLYVIFFGYTSTLMISFSFILAFYLFKEKGLLIVLIKVEDIPIDEFGKILPRDRVGKLSEIEKGSEIQLKYVYIDKKGILRLSENNIVKYLNDTNPTVILEGRLVDYTSVFVSNEREVLLGKIIPSRKINLKTIETKDSDKYFKIITWEFESLKILKELLKSCETKETTLREFIAQYSFSAVFQKLTRNYNDLQSKYQTLLKSKDLLIAQGVARELAEMSILEQVTTDTIEFDELENTYERQSGLEEFMQEVESKMDQELFESTSIEDKKKVERKQTENIH